MRRGYLGLLRQFSKEYSMKLSCYCFFPWSSLLSMAHEQSFSISTLLDLLSELYLAYIFHLCHGVQYWAGTTRFPPLYSYYQSGYFIRRWSVVKNVPDFLDGWIYIRTHFIPLTWITKNYYWNFPWHWHLGVPWLFRITIFIKINKQIFFFHLLEI